MNLNKRLSQLEAITAPEKIPETRFVLIGTRDQVHNRHQYDEVPHSTKGHRKIFELKPKPGYTPPEDPMHVNENPLPNN